MGTSRQFGGKPFARRLLSTDTNLVVDDTGRKISLPYVTLTLKVTVTEDARIYWTQADFAADNDNYTPVTSTSPFNEVVQVREFWMRREAAGNIAAVDIFGTIK